MQLDSLAIPISQRASSGSECSKMVVRSPRKQDVSRASLEAGVRMLLAVRQSAVTTSTHDSFRHKGYVMSQLGFLDLGVSADGGGVVELRPEAAHFGRQPLDLGSSLGS